MEIIPIGTGSAFTMNNRQTNYLIKNNGKLLLVDCGGDARHGLAALGLSYKDLDAIYISHLHADHIGGMEWASFCSYFDPSAHKIDLYAHHSVMAPLWDKALSAGLSSIQAKRVSLHDYFNTKPLADNDTFLFAGISADIVQCIHIVDNLSFVPSYGLMLHAPESADIIYLTTDAQHNPNQMRDFYNRATVIFQDCETTKFPSGVHAHYSELCAQTPEIKRRMRLTHYNDNVFAKPVTTVKQLIDLYHAELGDNKFSYETWLEGRVLDISRTRVPVLDWTDFNAADAQAKADGFWGFVKPLESYTF